MNSVIIVAAGSGKRMGSPIPKQFIEVNGKTILEHTIEVFLTSKLINEIVLVLAEDFNHIGSIIKKKYPKVEIKVCIGGKERFHSVQNALSIIDSNCNIVLVHDAVRPFFSHSLLESCINKSMESGCAVPVIDCKDSIRFINTDNSNKPFDRGNIKLIQTPQAFNYIYLQAAYSTNYCESFTDDATVFEKNGNDIQLIKGDVLNIKITTPEDLEIAKLRLTQSNA